MILRVLLETHATKDNIVAVVDWPWTPRNRDGTPKGPTEWTRYVMDMTRRERPARYDDGKYVWDWVTPDHEPITRHVYDNGEVVCWFEPGDALSPAPLIWQVPA